MPIYNAPILAVDPVETRRYAGLQKAEDFKQELIDNACQEAQLLIQPKGIWQIYDYNAESQTVYNQDHTVEVKLQGKSIGKHLQKACQVVIMSATIGEDIEDQVTRSFEEGKYSFSMLLDAAATTAIEEVADGMEKNIFNVVKRQGLAMTWRFSPGYGDFDICYQEPVVRMLNCAKTIGLTLTDSFMMTPTKSVTAVIGISTQKERCPISGCEVCTKKDCEYRR